MTTTSGSGLTGSAVSDLGIGAPLETEEEKKRRMAMAQQQQRSALGPAAMSLGLGGYGG